MMDMLEMYQPSLSPSLVDHAVATVHPLAICAWMKEEVRHAKSLQISCKSIAVSHHALCSVIMRYQDPTSPS
jgi:hypothetical protein